MTNARSGSDQCGSRTGLRARHPFKKWGRTNKNGTGKVGCPAPPEGSQHLNFFAPVVLYLAHGHLAIQRQALACSKSCPKTATYRSLRSLRIGSLSAVGRHENLLKNRPWFVSRVASALAFCTSACWQRAFRAFHAVKGEHDESTYPAGNDDHSATVLGS
jgi:hypothetical protein